MRKPWGSNPQAAFAATCFQNRLLIQPVGFHQLVVPGAGIEPAASTFRAWRHYQQQLPRSHSDQAIRFGKEDSNLHRLIQSQVAYL